MDDKCKVSIGKVMDAVEKTFGECPDWIRESAALAVDIAMMKFANLVKAELNARANDILNDKEAMKDAGEIGAAILIGKAGGLNEAFGIVDKVLGEVYHG